MPNKTPLVISFIHKHKYDITPISKTHFKPAHKFKIKNHYVIQHDRLDRPAQKGEGTALIIKNSLQFEQMPSIDVTFDHLIIKIDIYLVGVYNHPDNQITVLELQSATVIGNRVFMYGDLNAKHLLWDSNCIRPNPSGRIFTDSNDYITYHTDESTLCPYNGTIPSTFYIALVKNLSNIQNDRTIMTLTSDHDPVYLEIKTNITIIRHLSIYIDYKNANWGINKY